MAMTAALLVIFLPFWHSEENLTQPNMPNFMIVYIRGK